MEENRQKITWINIVPEMVALVVAAAGIYGYGFYNNSTADMALRNMVMVALGFAIVGFCLRQEYLNDALAYNNGSHLLRFWGAVAIGLAIAFASVFLPSGGWPFLTVFVMLTLYSNFSVGVLTSSVLLVIPTLLSGASAGVFFLYFISGVFAAGLFRHLENGFKIGIPWLLSMMCLFVCETANIVLMANEHLSVELFVVPVMNLIISSILLVGFLNIFSRAVVYEHRESYLELNDTENPILAEYKQENRADFFLCIHTTYFCERIANRLSLDVDAMKCVGYYHKLYGRLREQENAPEFPPLAGEILKEYQDKRTAVSRKETAVLLCADAIVSTIIYMFSKNSEKILDYDSLIDAVFKKFQDAGTFRNCNITMQELNTMQKIFKEEKLYYDFLR